MRANVKSQYESRARVVKAMAHAGRLLIVDELARGERCVRELADLVGSKMPTVSRHMAVLKSAGIVQDRKEGSAVYYSLRCPCVMQFFQCVETVMKQNVKKQQDDLRSRR